MRARDLLSVNDGSLVTLPYSGEWLAGRLMKVAHNTYSGVINVWWKVDRLGLVHAALDPEMSLFPQDHEEEPKDEIEAVQFTGVQDEEKLRRFLGADEDDVQASSGWSHSMGRVPDTFYSYDDNWAGTLRAGEWLVRRKGAIVELDNETYQVLFG